MMQKQRLPSWHKHSPISQRHSGAPYILGAAACCFVLLCVRYPLYNLLEGGQVQAIMPRAEAAAIGVAPSQLSSKSLELQLVEKQRLIEQLQAELARLSSGGSIRDDNLAAQEAVIRLLKEQSEAEMGARTTAQKALSEKAQALDKCLVQQHELAWEVQQCRAGVDQAHGGSYR